MYGQRIIIAGTEAACKNRQVQLTKAGFVVVATTTDGRKASQLIFEMQPHGVILEANLPRRNGWEVARITDEHQVAPVVMISEEVSVATLELARKAGVYACLVQPADENVLIPAVELAIYHFGEKLEANKENKRLQAEIQERKVVERAKGYLMETRGISEQEAYILLRKSSMDRCVPIARVAGEIVAELETQTRGRVQRP